MAKISQVSAKYIVHAIIHIEGVVDRPDVIGAIFGQTEGLLGSELELRELQRSGRIGRIEVNTDTKAGKTSGVITVPSSLDKAETAIIAAALEVIERIGPCNAKIKTQKIEDVRISKRKFVIERAKELLKKLTDDVLPDSQELADEVSYSVRVMEITEYGKDRLPAGPAVDEAEEVIVVEGRADVINLLKHGFKNVIAMNGSSVPQTIIELSKQKILTAFVDGDRGGDLNVQELIGVSELDFATKAPDGKEVEEITKKEIHKALRSKVAAEQVKLEFAQKKRPVPRPAVSRSVAPINRRPNQVHPRTQVPVRSNTNSRFQKAPPPKFNRANIPTEQEKKKFKQMHEDLIGTRGAYILDENLSILGKVPMTELVSTIKSLTTGVYAVVMDGIAEKALVEVAEKSRVKFLIPNDSRVKESRIAIVIADKL